MLVSTRTQEKSIARVYGRPALELARTLPSMIEALLPIMMPANLRSTVAVYPTGDSAQFDRPLRGGQFEAAYGSAGSG